MRPAMLHKGTSGIAVLAGLAAVITPFVWSVGTMLTWSSVVAGVVVAVLFAFTLYREMDDTLPHVAVPAVGILAGLVLIVAPFALQAATQQFLFATVVLGIIATLVGAYHLYAASDFGGAETGKPAT